MKRPSSLTKKLTRFLTVSISLMILAACQSSPPPVEQPKPAKVKPIDPELLKPISPITRADALFVQKALTKIGYKPGPVDGIWGPRSTTALSQFETDNNLTSISNNGQPSLYLLNILEQKSGIPRTSILASQPSAQPSLRQLARQAQTSKTPQLVFLNTNREMLVKPNPFSKKLRILQKDTGIYVLGIQEGWIHVETRDLVRGYITD
jgi:hypothetical protein